MIKVGLIGCGGIGVLRAQAIQSLPSFELKTVCDVNLAAAENLAGRFGCKAGNDWRTLVKDESLDAVIVSTPPHLHVEMCIEALDAGKHVLCEKPLARTPDECMAMVAAAERSGCFLATGFNYRFYHSILKAREILDSGLIGELDHIRSYAGYSASEHSQEWLHDKTIMGGGALRDNGIHLIDLTSYFLGDVVEVKGFTSNSVWNFEGCEDNGFALLKSRSDKIASLQASWTEWCGYELRLEIYGSRGCIRTWCFPMLTKVFWTPKEGARGQKKTYFFPKTFLGEHVYSYRWVVVQSFIKEFIALSRAINGEVSDIASGADGLRAVEIAFAVSQANEGYRLDSLKSFSTTKKRLQVN